MVKSMAKSCRGPLCGSSANGPFFVPHICIYIYISYWGAAENCTKPLKRILPGLELALRRSRGSDVHARQWLLAPSIRFYELQRRCVE